MSSAKAVMALCVAALAVAALAGCGTVDVKPSASATSQGTRGRVDSPSTTKPNHVTCLRADKLPVRQLGRNDLEIGTAPSGVRVHFEPTPGSAQSDQIQNREQAAEVIGSALLYPGAASDSQLTKIERCIAKGVSG